MGGILIGLFFGAILASSGLRGQSSYWPIPPAENAIMAAPAATRNLESLSARPQAFVLPLDKVFPHFATGGGWETILVLVNLSSTRIDFDQYFYDPAGRPLPVTSKSIPGGELFTTSAAAGRLGPGSSHNILLFDQGGPIKTGWSVISYDSSNSRLGGYAIFRQRTQGKPDFEALVPLSGMDDSIFVMPYDNIEGFVTAMAILNPGANLTSTVRVTILDSSGRTLALDSLVLAPGRQETFIVAERFPVTKNGIGTIRFEGSTNRLAGLGFRFGSSGAFATIPIMNWSGMFQ
jgi:hypothetical protein